MSILAILIIFVAMDTIYSIVLMDSLDIFINVGDISNRLQLPELSVCRFKVDLMSIWRF